MPPDPSPSASASDSSPPSPSGSLQVSESAELDTTVGPTPPEPHSPATRMPPTEEEEITAALRAQQLSSPLSEASEEQAATATSAESPGSLQRRLQSEAVRAAASATAASLRTAPGSPIGPIATPTSLPGTPPASSSLGPSSSQGPSRRTSPRAGPSSSESGRHHHAPAQGHGREGLAFRTAGRDYQECVELTPPQMNKVVGGAAGTVTAIQDATGARLWVLIPGRPHDPAAPQQLVISGTRASVVAARELVLQAAEHGPMALQGLPNAPPVPYPGALPDLTELLKAREEVDCPPELVGRVIGKGGETITNLQIRSGCRIYVNQDYPRDHPRKIILIGTPEAVLRGREMVREVMEFGPPEHNRRNPYLYNAAQAGPAGGRGGGMRRQGPGGGGAGGAAFSALVAGFQGVMGGAGPSGTGGVSQGGAAAGGGGGAGPIGSMGPGASPGLMMTPEMMAAGYAPYYGGGLGMPLPGPGGYFAPPSSAAQGGAGPAGAEMYYPPPFYGGAPPPPHPGGGPASFPFYLPFGPAGAVGPGGAYPMFVPPGDPSASGAYAPFPTPFPSLGLGPGAGGGPIPPPPYLYAMPPSSGGLSPHMQGPEGARLEEGATGHGPPQPPPQPTTFRLSASPSSRQSTVPPGPSSTQAQGPTASSGGAGPGPVGGPGAQQIRRPSAIGTTVSSSTSGGAGPSTGGGGGGSMASAGGAGPVTVAVGPPGPDFILVQGDDGAFYWFDPNTKAMTYAQLSVPGPGR